MIPGSFSFYLLFLLFLNVKVNLIWINSLGNIPLGWCIIHLGNSIYLAQQIMVIFYLKTFLSLDLAK